MISFSRSALPSFLAVVLIGLALAGCAGGPKLEQPAAPAVAPTPTLPPAFPAQDLIGRWGLAAYHQEADRDRMVKAAANQCSNPYIITPSPTGGVMMHLADEAQQSDLHLKGAPGGKTYLGLPGEPPGSPQDREVVSFDGRTLILRWVDPEVQGRYGSMVYVRCTPEGQKPTHGRRSKPKPKATPKPKPKPKTQ